MKKAFMILPVLILAIGAGLVLTGVVNIPGISPKAKKKAVANYASDKDKDPKVAAKTPAKKEPAKKPVVPPANTKPPTPKVEVATTEKKPEVGQKKLAKLWNEMEIGALKDLTKDWKDKDLAAILVRMDNGKVAEFLGALDAKRASSLSHELQNQASIVPVATGL